MESGGIEGEINISGATFEFVKYTFDYPCHSKIETKNKGLVDIYLVVQRNLECGFVPSKILQ